MSCACAAAAQEPSRFAAWPDGSALSVEPGRLVIGVFSQSAWGVTPRVEVRLHPLAFWVLPHAEAKLRWLDAGRWQLSTAHRAAHATPFLSLIAREGSGGLLPPTTDVPHAVLLENTLLGSVEWQSEQWLTASAGAAFAVVGAGDPILLDFPVLYQRFAALHAPVVPRFALLANGAFSERLAYSAEFRHYLLPLDDFPMFSASEYAAEIFVQLGPRHRIGAGARVSAARLPVGFRSHFLPYIDYAIAF